MNLGRKDGLTLTEVLIACTIMGVILSGLVTSFVMQQKGVAYANNRLRAMHGARQVMETLMIKSYYDSSLSVGVHAVSNGSYTVVENDGVKDVSLTLWWKDQGQAATQTVSLVTSIAYTSHR
ncbi:MAG: hypothetical protein C0404_02235 [Verrucomicrobia bacterium]|nr:hypothetical protein [Verrucomicrobiota bacterium]